MTTRRLLASAAAFVPTSYLRVILSENRFHFGITRYGQGLRMPSSDRNVPLRGS